MTIFVWSLFLAKCRGVKSLRRPRDCAFTSAEELYHDVTLNTAGPLRSSEDWVKWYYIV